MNQFQIALLIGAIVTLLMSRNLPRSWLWILCGTGSFAVSTAYARYNLPHPEAFAVACDAAVVLAIYHFAKENYELLLWRIFQTMILINILFFVGLIGPRWAYIIVLEVLNWAALFLILGTAITERFAQGEIRPASISANRVRGAGMALRRERAHAPWHKV